MDNLRSKLIRLASEHPELRSQLLPLLDDGGKTAVHVNPKGTAGLGGSNREFPNPNFSPRSGMVITALAPLDGPGFTLPMGTKLEVTEVKPLGMKVSYQGEAPFFIPKRFYHFFKTLGRLEAPKPALKPVNGTEIRKNYYESGDKIFGLVEAVKGDSNTKDDMALVKAVEDLQKAHSAVNAALLPYAWD